MSMRIMAVGQDAYWLAAVQKAVSDWAAESFAHKLGCQLPECLAALPEPDPDVVLLVDASGQSDMEQVVSALRTRGWRYVVVVAADPSASEAASVLRRGLGYDYWEKTYDEDVIRERVKTCLDEIAAKTRDST